MSEPEVVGGGCECWITPEHMWLSAASCGYGGGYEPGSQVEFNPDCPTHGYTPTATETHPEPTDPRRSTT